MQFTQYGNLKSLEYPNRSLQKCPLCGNLNPIAIYGFVADIYDKEKTRECPDRGYSFCNCNNIYYTDWANMDREIYDDSYVAKYDTETVLRLGTNLYREYAPFFSLKGLFVDIGCINDVIMDCAKKDGFETTGIDVAKRASKHTIINGNCEETIKTIKDASVIWFSHVLEHLQHPIVALQSVYNSIRSGGYLFLALPDPFFIDYADTMKWGHWHLREHHVFFEMTTLCKILQEIGFEIVTAKHNIEEKFICNYDMHIAARKN